jgi:hypothetical protein
MIYSILFTIILMELHLEVHKYLQVGTSLQSPSIGQ